MKSRLPAHIKNILSQLPKQPGVYQYFDISGTIIYIGKAKNLKNRVSSYFRGEAKQGKTALMVSRIRDIKYIIVNTEEDALLLELSLIKKHRPRYNVMWKDDKSYPWICIKNEPFPRVFVTRKLINDGSGYFGPYTSHMVMHTILELVKKLFKLRTCNLNLTEKKINEDKFRVCLEYHIGNCLGPCEKKQSLTDYQNSINGVREILKGNLEVVRDELIKEMSILSGMYHYEEAQKVKERLNILEKYQSRSTVVSPTLSDIDVFSIVFDEKFGYVNYLRIIKGAIIQSHTLELKKKLDETPQQLLDIAIAECRQRFESNALEIIVPVKPGFSLKDVKITVPRKGDKKKLLVLSERNARHTQLLKIREGTGGNLSVNAKRTLTEVMVDLQLPVLPVHIECFDNSNIQGEFPVASCVVFKNGLPSTDDYRIFNLRTVTGPDDFSSMKEVVFRRYKRLLEENQPFPQLIVIDGGKGQLSSAANVLETLRVLGKVKVIAIAKRMEEFFVPGREDAIRLDKNSECLKLIQRIRNEAHRFGIKHHRNRRVRETLGTELSKIEGVGEKTTKILLTKFGSVKKIKELSVEELAKVVGKSKAKKIFGYLS